MSAALPAGNEVMALSVRQIVRRIHAEVLRNNVDGLSGIDAAALWPDGYAVWAADGPRVTPDPDGVYDVAELLLGEDAQFVRNAYRTILWRPPDAAGFASNLEALRNGAASKLAILAGLRFSPEGMLRAVPIRGLRKVWLLERWKRKPGIGPLIGWISELSRLGRRRTQIERAHTRLSQDTDRLGTHVNQIVLQAGTTMERLEQHSATTQVALDRIGRQLQHLDQVVEQLSQREAGLQAQERKAARMAGTMDKLYSEFEETFRGSKAVVRERARPYLDLVRAHGAGTDDAPVIDVGCGRGEWLELLGEHGLVGRGIDLNATFVATARQQGLDVTHGDAVDVLLSLPAGSVGAITSMHLVEHLPFEHLVEMIDACRHALRPGGVLILETPNPENLDVATVYFYMDPTHRNPLPPQMLRFMVAARGFADARILPLTEARPLNAPPLVDADVAGAASINNLIERTHVAPDYAVVATREQVDVQPDA